MSERIKGEVESCSHFVHAYGKKKKKNLLYGKMSDERFSEKMP